MSDKGDYIMYKIIHILSALIRQFLLPNPYNNFFNDAIYADLFNVLIGGTILHILSFLLTGVGYIKGVNSPASGSLGYLISYIYLTALITVLGFFIKSVKILIIVFIIIYIISIIIVGKIFRKQYNF